MSVALVAYYVIPAIGFICCVLCAVVVLAAVVCGGQADDAMEDHYRTLRAAERRRVRSRNRRGF